MSCLTSSAADRLPTPARAARVGHGPARRRREPARALCRRTLRPRLWPADIVRKLERSGYEFNTIVVSGGAARSAWCARSSPTCAARRSKRRRRPEPVLLGSAMVGAVAAGTQTMASAMSSMSAIATQARAPAGGRSRRFHARKRRAFAMLRRDRARKFADFESVIPLACSGRLSIATGLVRQRSDRARRHPPHAWRGRPAPDHEETRSVSWGGGSIPVSANRRRTRDTVAQRVPRRTSARNLARLRARS